MHRSLAQETIGAEKRAYQRVPIAIGGKIFFPATGTEQDCVVTDISLGGATLQCDAKPEIGTEIVLYLPGFDRFAGTVMRSDAIDAGMRFSCTEARREKTAEKIMRHIAGVLPDATRLRRTERVAMPAPRQFTRPDGQVVDFEVRDISLSGASLKTTVRPPLGEIVMVGSTAGRIVRHFDDGIALEFVKLA